MVYLGSSLAQAGFELVVHLEKSHVLSAFRQLKVSFDDRCIVEVDLKSLPNGWEAPAIDPVTQILGDAWAAGSESLILKVPSATIYGEFNYLLNPTHPDMTTLKIGPILPFAFDPRIVEQPGLMSNYV